MFIINVLKSGTLALPRNLIFTAMSVIVLVYLLSSLLGAVPSMSLIGYGFEVTTFTTILLSGLLMSLVAVLCQSSRKLTIIYTSFFIVSSLIALFHIARLFFGANFLSFGYFPNIISNTIGKWNELAIFFGISTILSFVALDTLRLRARLRFGLFLTFILSLAILIVVNLPVVWYVTGAVSLGFFIYLLTLGNVQSNTLNVVTSGGEETKMKSVGRIIPYRSLIVIIIAFIFAFTSFGASFGAKINEKFGIDNIEVRPSWSATYGISKHVFNTNPILGSGPNRFGIAWQLYRPDVNLSNFWNTNFNHGVGFIPTTIVETGILGMLAWLAFFLLFILLGLRSIFSRSYDRLSGYFIISSFVTALYLWIMNVLYMPNIPLLALTFFFTGLSIAAAASGGILQTRTVSFFKYPRMSFVVVMGLVFVLVLGIGLGYLVFEKTLSSFYFAKGTVLAANAQNKENMDVAVSNILRAIDLSPNDIYYRSLAELDVLRLQNIISGVASAKAETISDTVRSEFQNVLAAGIEASRNAGIRDKENYENWLPVAHVYESIIPVGVATAYDGAKAAYEEAAKRSPRNPAIYLALAQLELSQKNLPKAKENVDKSIELKSNYLDAIFLQSQIDAALGNIREAAISTEKILSISPNNPPIYFRLGLLKYELKDWNGASKAFEQAITLVPVYANARYFLGLSYEKLGRVSDALVQFEELAKTNPDNKEIELILTNLKAGRTPFESVKPPLDNKPEKRKKLPVTEKDN